MFALPNERQLFRLACLGSRAVAGNGSTGVGITPIGLMGICDDADYSMHVVGHDDMGIKHSLVEMLRDLLPIRVRDVSQGR